RLLRSLNASGSLIPRFLPLIVAYSYSAQFISTIDRHRENCRHMFVILCLGIQLNLSFLLWYLGFESFSFKRQKATEFKTDESLSLKASL
ncbi:hypothetical protein V5098_27280, partial [Vibrio coralliirubri]|uniref:hypothetical protein n=1 Tax=Vibrio coralliirubri TaxID=1516159 RepID=UPI002FD0E479